MQANQDKLGRKETQRHGKFETENKIKGKSIKKQQRKRYEIQEKYKKKGEEK